MSSNVNKLLFRQSNEFQKWFLKVYFDQLEKYRYQLMDAAQYWKFVELIFCHFNSLKWCLHKINLFINGSADNKLIKKNIKFYHIRNDKKYIKIV